MLVAGDIFNSKNQSLAAQLKFVTELKRLTEPGISCYFVCGNHDPLNSWIPQLQLPPMVYRFAGKETQVLTHHKNGKALADIYGISFENEAVTANLAKKIIQCRMENSDPAPFQLALMHGTAGQPGPHKLYAPFSLEEVAGQKFDYWALGHIHKRQVLRGQDPAVVYPGNPQGRDFGETGSRGCFLVGMNKTTGPEVRFIPTQTIRFEELMVNLSGEESINSLYDKITDAVGKLEHHDEGINLIVRLYLKGQTPLHRILNQAGEIEQLLQVFNEGQLYQSPFIWYDSIHLQTSPQLDIDEIRKGKDFPAEILKRSETMTADKQWLEEFFRETHESFSTPQTRKDLAGLTAEDQAEIAEKAKWMLLEYFLKDQE